MAVVIGVHLRQVDRAVVRAYHRHHVVRLAQRHGLRRRCAVNDFHAEGEAGEAAAVGGACDVLRARAVAPRRLSAGLQHHGDVLGIPRVGVVVLKTGYGSRTGDGGQHVRANAGEAPVVVVAADDVPHVLVVHARIRHDVRQPIAADAEAGYLAARGGYLASEVGVARFDNLGNARALLSGTGNRVGSTFFRV